MASRALPTLLTLATLLAGCLGSPAPSAPAEPLAPAPPPAAPTAGVVHLLDSVAAAADVSGVLPAATGLQLPIGVSSFEPTLGVTPDGALFMSGFAPGGGLPGIGPANPTSMRSKDHGMTWEDKGPKLPTGDGNPWFTNDPYVYVDFDTGRVFQVDLYALVCSWLSYSDDQGDTWVTNPFDCGTPLVNDHQTVAAGPSRLAPMPVYPNVVYYCVNRVVDSACAHSYNGGLTMSPLITVYPGVENGNVCGGLHGHVKTDHEGRVFVPKGQCGVAEVAVSEDNGLTWTRHVISDEVHPAGHEVAVAADEANNLYALWMGSEDGLPYFAASKDHGATWSQARKASPPGVTGADWPAIAAGADGKVAFAYVGTTIADGYKGKDTADSWKGATWNAYIGTISDALADEPVVVTVTANDPADPVARGACGHSRCGGIGDFIDIVIDTEGRPWAAFVDVCRDKCVTDASAANGGGIGFTGTMATGPALRGDATELPPLAPPAPVPPPSPPPRDGLAPLLAPVGTA